LEQGVDPLASRQLSLLVLAAHLVGPAALLEARFELAVFRGEGFKTTQGRWGSRRDMLGSPLFDVFHQVCRGGARSEQPPDPLLAQRGCISPGLSWGCPVRTTARSPAGATRRCPPEG